MEIQEDTKLPEENIFSAFSKILENQLKNKTPETLEKNIHR